VTHDIVLYSADSCLGVERLVRLFHPVICPQRHVVVVPRVEPQHALVVVYLGPKPQPLQLLRRKLEPYNHSFSSAQLKLFRPRNHWQISFEGPE